MTYVNLFLLLKTNLQLSGGVLVPAVSCGIKVINPLVFLWFT